MIKTFEKFQDQPKYKIGEYIIADMGDETSEYLKINGVSKMSPPNGDSYYIYSTREYKKIQPNMRIPEELIIKKVTKKEYDMNKLADIYDI